MITAVNGVSLSSAANVLQVLDELNTSTSWDVTVKHWDGSSWTTLNYGIDLAS
jgi:hypothetical protein